MSDTGTDMLGVPRAQRTRLRAPATATTGIAN
jgi:hypothetical protein